MPTATLPALAFRAEPRPFREAVAWVAKHVANNPVIPTLAGVLLEVADDGILTIASFDYEIAATARIDVVGETPGRALVSGRLLAGLAGTFPDKPVDVGITETQMTIRCGGVRVTLPLMIERDYPTLPEHPPTLGTVPAGEFGALVERVVTAADRDASGGVKWLYGVHLVLGDQHIEAIGTDRYRIAVGRQAWNPAATHSGAPDITVPSPTMLDVAKTFQDGELTISGDANVIGFASPTRSLVVRLLAEKRPDRDQLMVLIPARTENPAVLPIADLLVALKRVHLLGDDTTAILSFTADGLNVTSRGGTIGESSDVIDCDYAGKDVAVCLNPRYLAEALSALRSEKAALWFTFPVPPKPVLVTVPEADDQDYRHAIVPLRLS
jgi:DNA polymerase-3 subunit beta